MNDRERSDLLLAEEKSQEHVKSLKQTLDRLGMELSRLSHDLISSPQTVVFSNAPPNSGGFPPELLGQPRYDWEILKNAISDAARLVKEYREEAYKLYDIQRQLGKPADRSILPMRA